MTDTAVEHVEALVQAAARAAVNLADLEAVPLSLRAELLRAVADALDGGRDELVAAAATETGLGVDRLRGEVGRTTGQLRMFAGLVEDGGFLDVVIDPADPDATPPRPELRRMNEPIGPVAVYAASNFPFAFSVAGGDTASALAAGCPVVVKAHPGHPDTAERTARLVSDALGPAPPGTFSLVHGFEAGRELVTASAIRAAAFTGSLRGGRALFDLACGRPDPIPFYGEMGSVNPVFVTPAAVRERGADIAAGYVASYTLGAGQFCTKPGLVFLPAGHGLAEALTRETGRVGAHRLLTDGIAAGYAGGVDGLAAQPGVTPIVPRTADPGPDPARDSVPESASDSAGAAPDLAPEPALYAVAARDLTPALWEERFGPVSLIVEYEGPDELLAAAASMPGSLTATIHAEPEDTLAADLLAVVRRRAGRVIWNGWPTGVAVTAAMHHGGPWPATTAPLHTSVGTAAIRRFLVPVVYQNTPEQLLPGPLRAR
jgi:NADP-dependent aldehyde dehydrogenase